MTEAPEREPAVSKAKSIPPEVLRELLDYDPENGTFFWKERSEDQFKADKSTVGRIAASWNSRRAGTRAFVTPDESGRLSALVLSIRVDAARVAYAIHYGKWPKGHIDHIDGDCANNRISNLRDVTHLENMKNVKRRIDNSSGVTGVRRRNGKWIAENCERGRRKCLGQFEEKEHAIIARKAAEKVLGFHENHGRTALEEG